MTLTDGFYDVPKGHLATTVTHLEMRSAPALRDPVDPPSLSLVNHDSPDAGWYRALFRQVGQDYLWFSRLRMTGAELRAVLSDPDYHLYTPQRDGVDLGLLELDFRTPGACELALFGLDAALIGSGAGRWMMSQAIGLAFARPINRFHVHTCTLDSPQALPFYIRSGFTPYRTQVEVTRDPRLTGDLPRNCAPQIPLIPPV